MRNQFFDSDPTQLLVLGNGFDLQSDLKTSYFDFINYVLSENNNHDFKRIEVRFKKEQKNEKNPVVDAESIYPVVVYENVLQSELNLFGIKYYHNPSLPIDFTKLNIWYLIFLNEKLQKNPEWNSIENLINKYVNDELNHDFLDDFLTCFFIKANENYIEFLDVTGRLKKYNPLAQYLVQYIFENYSTSVLVENLHNIPQLTDHFINSNYHEFTIFHRGYYKKLFIEFLLAELQELEKDFQVYLLTQLFANDKQYTKKSGLLVNKMTLDSTSHFNIYSFNYTKPWEKWPIATTSRINKTFNVHGNLSGSESGKCYPIFGIDKGEIDPNSLEYRFTKEYRTFDLYMTTDYAADNEGIFPDKNYIDAIKFYGHSLAEADYSYFQHLFDYYDLYNNTQLKLIFYYSVYDDSKKEEIKQEQMTNILRLLDTYGATLDNSYHGKNLSTHLIQTGRLKLVEI